MPFISIAVRSHNDEAFVARTLHMLESQICGCPFEIIICDDASTDSTPGIIATFPNVRTIPRPEGTYRPGRTINALVRSAKGDIVVFNNADAIPQNNVFLSEIVRPLLDGKAEAVYANQLARPDAQWLVRKDNLRAFGDGRTAAGWKHAFFSLASSAIFRQKALELPFNEEIKYSEDIEWVARNRIRVAYAPNALVEHSHNYTLKELARRFYGEGYADAQIYGERPSLARELVGAACETFRDFLFLARHPGGWLELPMAPVRRFTQRYRHWKGSHDFLEGRHHA